MPLIVPVGASNTSSQNRISQGGINLLFARISDAASTCSSRRSQQYKQYKIELAINKHGKLSSFLVLSINGNLEKNG